MGTREFCSRDDFRARKIYKQSLGVIFLRPSYACRSVNIENFNIALRAKRLRLRAKISQEEFAEHAGMNPKFYQQIESGRRSHLRVETVERICAAYGIELWEFFHPDAPEVDVKLKAFVSSTPHNTRRRGRPRKNQLSG